MPTGRKTSTETQKLKLLDMIFHMAIHIHMAKQHTFPRAELHVEEGR